MKRIVLFIFLVISGYLFSQSEELLDRLYEEENARTLEASLLVLQASGNLDKNSTIESAREFLSGSKWGESVLKDGEYLTVGGFSLLVVEAFDLPHGLIYNILPIRRYALKEMLFKKYIPGNPYPEDQISSFNVVYTLSSLSIDETLDFEDEEELLPAEEDISDEPTSEESLEATPLEAEEVIVPEIIDEESEVIAEEPVIDDNVEEVEDIQPEIGPESDDIKEAESEEPLAEESLTDEVETEAGESEEP